MLHDHHLSTDLNINLHLRYTVIFGYLQLSADFYLMILTVKIWKTMQMQQCSEEDTWCQRTDAVDH